MHETQMIVVERMLRTHWIDVGRQPTTVYDIGSYDVNGSHRGLVEGLGFKYLGADIEDGPNVDVVIEPYNWDILPDDCQVIISGSCLEHVEAPWLWAEQAYKHCAPGGLLVVTTPYSIGEHRHPVDCYRYLPDGFKYLFTDWVKFNLLECDYEHGPDAVDSFFVGRR